MNSALEGQVWKIQQIDWNRAKENEMSRRFYHVLLKWIPYANKEFREWDVRPDTGHFFGGDFWYSSESASTALVFAVAAKLGEYSREVTGIDRDELKEKAIKAIRYMGFTHDTGPEDCIRVNGRNHYTAGKKWGGKDDHFFMASQNGRSISSFATAAWLLWDDLDDETKTLVQNVVSSYADRFCEEPPRSGSFYDTQCEEDAWTTAGLAAAVALFPEHPHHERWKDGFVNWGINTITTSWDRLTSRSGLIEKTDNHEIKTINFLPDYTTENHAFVHPSYLCAGINLRAVHAILAYMSGEPVNSSAIFNNEKLYEKTVKIWAQFDGLAVPIQGQDWWYNRHHERQFTHAVLNVVHKNKSAALFERRCLETIEKIQMSNPSGCLLEEEEYVFNPVHAQSSKDFEPGSALDLVNSYLLHIFGGDEAEPARYQELADELAGVHYYPFGCSIINRTKDAFTSFSWRNNVTLLTLPEQGLWNITPLFHSYTGMFTFKQTKAVKALSNQESIRHMDECRIHQYENGFGATGVILRGDDEIAQEVAVVSLPNGYTAYYEKVKVLKDCDLERAATGIIGVRNENYKGMPDLAPGKRTLYLPETEETFDGYLAAVPDRKKSWKAPDYVNLDSKIGFILKGSHGVTYINRHQYDRWKGIEDQLILNDMDPDRLTTPGTLEPFVVLAMPNQTIEETRQAHKNHDFLTCETENTQLLIIKDYLIYINFNKAPAWVSGRTLITKESIYIFEGVNKLGQRMYRWETTLQGYQSGYYVSEWVLSSKDFEHMNVEIHVQSNHLLVLNHSGSKVKIELFNKKLNKPFQITVEGFSFERIHSV
ncbi:hypothetical protein A8F94_14080 [Bacillus sp. FJAT-27225]|uniref:hypothetical protein n=1 Tax=Bacillus sp. FJAT-27225 TaxID=1743144 RepID=UPI00080C2793|nr:hypothetical protein [Bacillus sp. FJAT-27225]OCA85971.1 hypothetical protein A8F94_14080 [Bacillus sp. FJAT-27225]